MAAGFFLLAVLHPLPIAPPGGAATLEVLVQGEEAAAALAAVGGRPLVALPPAAPASGPASPAS
jgi:hypothetical protein